LSTRNARLGTSIHAALSRDASRLVVLDWYHCRQVRVRTGSLHHWASRRFEFFARHLSNLDLFGKAGRRSRLDHLVAFCAKVLVIGKGDTVSIVASTVATVPVVAHLALVAVALSSIIHVIDIDRNNVGVHTRRVFHVHLDAVYHAKNSMALGAKTLESGAQKAAALAPLCKGDDLCQLVWGIVGARTGGSGLGHVVGGGSSPGANRHRSRANHSLRARRLGGCCAIGARCQTKSDWDVTLGNLLTTLAEHVENNA